MQTAKTFLNWSSGKDSALALYYLKKDPQYSVDHLLTTINSHYNRVSMHGLRRELLQQQVAATGISSDTVELPEQPDMSTYEQVMNKKLSALRSEGFTHAAFGDIFLADLKAYRERQFNAAALSTVFPIWKKNTRDLMEEFLNLGFRAIAIAVNSELLDESFAGRELDISFVDDLPSNVDPCGENGEFHTFCYDGPVFDYPVAFEIGEKQRRVYPSPGKDKESKVGFCFCDLKPKNSS